MTREVHVTGGTARNHMRHSGQWPFTVRPDRSPSAAGEKDGSTAVNIAARLAIRARQHGDMLMAEGDFFFQARSGAVARTTLDTRKPFNKPTARGRARGSTVILRYARRRVSNRVNVHCAAAGRRRNAPHQYAKPWCWMLIRQRKIRRCFVREDERPPPTIAMTADEVHDHA